MHVYELDGIEYPSVTTILKLISIDDKLLKWANAMGFKHKNIENIQLETADFGTTVHSNLRTIIDPKAPSPIQFKDPRKLYDWSVVQRKFYNYFKNIKYRTVDTEVTLISPTLGYAGTLDWLAYILYQEVEKLFLLDFKTSKLPKSTMFLQLGGYYNLLKENSINVDMGGIIIINDRECGLYSIRKEVLEEFAEAFISLFQFYKIWSKLNDFKPDYDIVRVLQKTT